MKLAESCQWERMRMATSRESLIRLNVERRDDGSYFVSSPEVPLFYLAIGSEMEMQTVVLPVLKETMERNLRAKVDLRFVRMFETMHVDTCGCPSLPAHVIAQLAA